MNRHILSFGHAFDGLAWAIKTQPNFRVHILVSLFVIAIGYFLRVRAFEWLILILTITLGIVIELINTAVEATTDLLVSHHNQFAKVAKDTAAAAMLIYAVGASIVGLMIFVPKIL